ncbi:MAG: DOMON domain-containing protein [Candidatus Cloacimonetes bacterium]|nr:DOMON domain-containing protein [Candidatus Cloacimonadota bacterium]
MKNILFLLLAAFALISCETVWDEPFSTSAELPDSEGYYQTTAGDFILKYKVIENNMLACRLSGNGTGWIAVGFDPSAQMRDANFIIGYVAGIYGVIRDDFGTSSTSHNADTSLGGTNDVLLISNSETAGRTMLEFELPLDSGDAKDKPLSVGNTYNVIFAAGSEDDVDSMHNRIASGSILIR